MENKMDILQLEDNVERQLSLEDSHCSDMSHGNPPVVPCIGSEHQAEIPNLATQDERCVLMASSIYSCKLPVYDYRSVVGLSIPIIWRSHPPSEVNTNEDKLRTVHSSEIESRTRNRYLDGKVTSVRSQCNITSEHDSAYPDPHAVLPVDQAESTSSQVHDRRSTPCFTGECLDLNDRPMEQKRDTEQFASLPGLSASVWTDLEEGCFLLGLHIFGKNLSLLSKFVGSKTVGDTLSYYYGWFYNQDSYRSWSHCRKTRASRCILGKSIFTGRRRKELISRLKSKMPKEAHDSVAKVLKSRSDGLISLEECAFTLKSTIGPETFIEVIGIGKGKHDLTRFVQDTSKTNQVLSVCANMPKGMNCSMLATEDIIKFLIGDFRRSKTKINDVFWEAVWPRLLARGWHSEQPEDVRTAKNCLVFIVPGIEKFSREKLTKGANYFDSVADVLKKVAADPTLLELEIDGIHNGETVYKNVQATVQDDPLNCDQEVLQFTIVDTSLVPGEEPLNVTQLRSLPADANICTGPSDHSDGMLSDNSPQEPDGGDSSSDDQEDRGQATAHVNDIGTFPVYNKIEEFHVDLLENKGSTPCSVFPVNAHSSDDQHSDISSGNGDKIELTCISGLGTKTGRRVYLSPKRRRVARCSNDQTSQESYSFSNGDGLEKHKSKPSPTSTKPAVVDIGSSFQSRTLANCSMEEEPGEEIDSLVKSTTNGGPHENSNSVNEATFPEGKVDTEKMHPEIKIKMANLAREGAQVSTHVIDLNKPEASPGDETSMEISSENHGCLKANADGAPSISDREMVPDVLETAGKPGAAALTNSRRHGTRNRPPTARALEAVALGLLGGSKRKSDPKSLKTSRPSQRPCKNKEQIFTSGKEKQS